MGKQWEKYLRKLSPKQIKRIRDVLHAIREGNRDGLDIVSIQGEKNLRRCRVGNLRILFSKTSQGYQVKKILPRGDVYSS